MNNFKRLVLGVIFIGVISLMECVIARSGADDLYYEFLDSYGEYKLLRRANDLYIEKLDGSESRKITYTPNNYEVGYLIEDAKYLLVAETQLDGKTIKYYVIPSDKDDTKKKEIIIDEYYRHLYKYHPSSEEK